MFGVSLRLVDDLFRRYFFLNPASHVRRLAFCPLSPSIRDMGRWKLVGWVPERNVSPYLAPDSRRLKDVPTPSKMVEESLRDVWMES